MSVVGVNVSQTGGAVPAAALSIQQTQRPGPSRGIFELWLLDKFDICRLFISTYIVVYFSLGLCPPQTSSCYGCTGRLKPHAEIPPSPQDLVVVARTNRQFTDPNGQLKTKEGNVYFHARDRCVQSCFPEFLPSLVYIPHYVKERLDVDHVLFLQAWKVPI